MNTIECPECNQKVYLLEKNGNLYFQIHDFQPMADPYEYKLCIISGNFVNKDSLILEDL
jgi:hypothetical protein